MSIECSTPDGLSNQESEKGVGGKVISVHVGSEDNSRDSICEIHYDVLPKHERAQVAIPVFYPENPSRIFNACFACRDRWGLKDAVYKPNRLAQVIAIEPQVISSTTEMVA